MEYDLLITGLLDVNRIRAGQGLPIERAPVELRQVVADTLEELSTSSPSTARRARRPAARRAGALG